MIKNSVARKRAVTVKDIAEVSGYSIATISRAINLKPGLSDETRKAVLAFCEKLGYVANSSARSLKKQRTFMIGTIIPTLDNAAYARMIIAIQNELLRSSFTLIHTESNFNLAIEFEQAKLLIERGAEGLILLGVEHAPELFSLINRRQIPCVTTYSYFEDSKLPCVGFDNFLAMYEAVDFLIKMGHHRFAYISGVMKDNDRVSERMRGVMARIHEGGFSLPDRLIQQAPYTIMNGYQAMKGLLKYRREFTAVICGSDILAFGALSACRDNNVKVPDDLSIIGFDNQHFAQHLWPPLTTVETPGDTMGELAANKIVNAVENNTAIESVLLKTSIVHRKTVGLPRRDNP
jgi:LacI family transcriptional regulator